MTREKKMTCPTKTNNAEILVDYCAGTLDPARVDEFVQHFQTCDGCRRAVEAQREVWGVLDGWTPPQVSPDFDARLYARIAREGAAPQWKRWLRGVLHPAGPHPFWKPAVGLAAACAVLAVGFLVRTPNPVDTSKQIRADNVDIEQVEQTLADLDMLTPVSKL
jgi:anti-sigma factor RsiW